MQLFLIFTAELSSNFMNIKGLKLRTVDLIEIWTDDPRRGFLFLLGLQPIVGLYFAAL
jgi:hypothetical protein